ncbi:MAG: DNA polymerase III subunit beta [Actinobacteria bacterium]|nr:DNA polymerase III subunit beta [Actinomycetota bacterium]
MKITATRQDLLDALLITSRAVSARAALQALSGIHLSANGEPRMRATDMELGLDVALEGKCDGAGAVVLPGRLLVEVARSLPDGEVTLELREQERDVELTAGSSRFHLRTIPADDFPLFPEAEGDPLELPAEALRETIGRVARAASRDEARPVLTGVLVTAEEKQLTMVATDSYRLAVKRTELDAPFAASIEANVPARALRELARLTEAAPEDPLQVWLTRNQALFRLGSVQMSSRLIDGQFPSYRQLLPESFEHEVRLPRAELLEVTRRVSQLAQRNAALRLAFAQGELVVSAETPDLGDAREALPAPYEGSEPLEIGFNPEFVRDGLESIDDDEVVLKLISSLRPGLIEPAGSDDFSYLVMPIRLNV